MRQSVPARLIAALAAAFILVLLLLLVIQIQQRVLRHRAEALLLDIRTLQLRSSSWSDATALMHKWGAWGHYEGTCASAECSYNIELTDALTRSLNKHPKLSEHWEWFVRPYFILGGKPVRIQANLNVLDGRVWGKKFSAFITVPPEKQPNAPFGGYFYQLIGEAGTVSRFFPSHFWPQLAEHSEYVVGTPDGCTMCLAMFVKFTPFATQSDTERLMDFNLEGITRWRPCRGKAEIMPAAWKEYQQGASKRDRLWDDLRACNYPMRLLARDTENAVVAEVTADRTESGISPDRKLRMKLLTSLKGAAFWRPQTEEDVLIYAGTVARTAHKAPADVLLGKRYALLFREDKYGGPNRPKVWLDPCGCIPATSENITEVREGVDRDFASRPSPNQ